jgi:hypothetical protein
MKQGAIVVGIVALAAGFVIGWFVHATPTPPTPPPPPVPAGSQVIRVGPGANQVNPPKVRIAKHAADVLFWMATNPKQELRIETVDEIFAGELKQANGRYAVTCSGRMCYSGEILDAAPEGKDLKYWQVLVTNGQPEEADGYVIIER